ncbi:LOW QUALITY PROTEIN: polycystin-1-like protein 3 [Erethizon dorsatum]
MSLMALGKIQNTFLQKNPFSESLVTLTSSTAALMVSNQNTSTLPLSSNTLGHPSPVRFSFPAISALKELLNKHPGVNVQMIGLTFNPFEDFDDCLFQCWKHWKHVTKLGISCSSMETDSTILNTSTDHFTITVNIASLEKSLIVSLQPENPFLMTLHLGFPYQPTHTRFHLSITLPEAQVWQRDEACTWVLTPESRQYGICTTTNNKAWKSDGCQVRRGEGLLSQRPLNSEFGAARTEQQSERKELEEPEGLAWVGGESGSAEQERKLQDSEFCLQLSSTLRGRVHLRRRSTALRTQCPCNRLAVSGSECFIVPRGSQTQPVRSRDRQPCWGIAAREPPMVSVTFLAWAKDQADIQKVKASVLADNNPSSQFHYLIQRYTGYGRRAANAKVVITLYGSEGGEPHHLCGPQKTAFERGGLGVFCSPLSPHWGPAWPSATAQQQPSRYINQVIVSDVAARRKWHFWCDCWLARAVEEGEHDQVFIPFLFTNKFSYSSPVVPYNSIFDFRKHKLNIPCITLEVAPRYLEGELHSFALLLHCYHFKEYRHLFSSMIIEKFTLDSLCLSVAIRNLWKQFPGVQRLACCLTLLFCVMVVNVMLWKVKGTTAERDERSRLLQQVDPRGANEFRGGTLGLSQGHQLCDFLEAASQLHKLCALLEMQILPPEQGPSREATSFPILTPEEGKPTSIWQPKVLTSICWVLLGVSSLASAFFFFFFFLALYSLELSKDQATSWVISILSVLQNIFISQPVKTQLPQDDSSSEPGCTVESPGKLSKLCFQGCTREGPPPLLDTSNLALACCAAHPGKLRQNSADHPRPRGNHLHRPCLVRILQHLEQRPWLDQYTKAAFVEFVVFNTNVNLFCVVTLTLKSHNRTFLSSAVTVVGLLMGISHHKEVTVLHPVLGSFLILTSVILMILVIINLFVSAILMASGKESPLRFSSSLPKRLGYFY